jgi:HK97 family phage major capsid protein
MPRSDTQAGLDYVDSVLRDLNVASETRDLTPDEWTSIDEGLAYVAQAKVELARYDALSAAAETSAAKPADAARDFQVQRRVETDQPTNIRSLSPGELRDRGLAVAERAARDYDLRPDQERKVEQLTRRRDGWLAARLIETENELYRSAFMKMMYGRPLNDAEARAMSITTTTTGGYGIPVFIDPTIMITDQGSTNPFWSIANVKTITNADWKGVSAAGVTMAFETEAAAANDLTPTLDQPVVHAHKIQGAIPFSIEVEMDYPEFASEVGNILLTAYDDKCLQKFTIGSGTTEPWGIFEACENATCQVTVGTDGSLAAADIGKVFAALPQKFRQNASWVMSIDANQDIQGLGDDKLSTQTVNLAAGAIDVLKGRPVYESSYAPSYTATTGAASIAVVGDFSNFVIAQRAGFNVEGVQHLVESTTSLPTGQRAIYAWARVGSDSVLDNAFRMLVNT